MITIDISEQYRKKFNKLLALYQGRHDELVSAIITYKINDLKKGINNIEVDLEQFESKYKMDTSDFYENFAAGKMGDENDDFLVWSGEYEVLQEYKNDLEMLS
jgi:Mg2+ and Co2+ transporter CorA